MSNAAAQDFTNHQSIPDFGYRADLLSLPTSVWRLGADGLSFTAATTPAAVIITDGLEVVQWAANAANTVLAGTQFKVPGEYNPTPVFPPRPDATADTTAKVWALENDDLKFIATIRRGRNAADSAAFNARLTVTWMTPGGNAADVSSFTTNPTAAIASIAADNGATLEGFSDLTFDIGARLRAEGKRINPGDIVRMRLGVDAANANATMQFAGGVLRGRRGSALKPVLNAPALNSRNEYSVTASNTRG